MNPQSAIRRRKLRLEELAEQQRARATATTTLSEAMPEERHINRPPEKLPDPWLFNSESLLRELDRCRELVLEIPATNHSTHFAVNVAITALWNLRENLRCLLLLHREGQQSFARKTTQPKRVKKTAADSQKIVGIRA